MFCLVVGIFRDQTNSFISFRKRDSTPVIKLCSSSNDSNDSKEDTVSSSSRVIIVSSSDDDDDDGSNNTNDNEDGDGVHLLSPQKMNE